MYKRIRYYQVDSSQFKWYVKSFNYVNGFFFGNIKELDSQFLYCTYKWARVVFNGACIVFGITTPKGGWVFINYSKNTIENVVVLSIHKWRVSAIAFFVFIIIINLKNLLNSDTFPHKCKHYYHFDWMILHI